MTGGKTLSDPITQTNSSSAQLKETTPDPDQMLALVLNSLEKDLALDIVQIDLRGRSAMADHMVIASGRNARHVAAIADKLIERLKSGTGHPPRIEGKEGGDWVLVDADDVIIHLFRPEVRAFYQLEKIWMLPDALARLKDEQPHLMTEAPADS